MVAAPIGAGTPCRLTDGDRIAGCRVGIAGHVQHAAAGLVIAGLPTGAREVAAVAAAAGAALRTVIPGGLSTLRRQPRASATKNMRARCREIDGQDAVRAAIRGAAVARRRADRHAE